MLTAGTVVRPAHLGVLASIGRHWSCRSTGRPGSACSPPATSSSRTAHRWRPGQIRESNKAMLLGLVTQAGCEPVDLGLVRDDEAAITAAIEGAVEACDAVVTSGGVSMGDFDLVKVVLDRIGRHAVDADRHQAGQAVRVRPAERRRRRDAAVRPARQPGVVARELRAARPPGAAPDDGPPPSGRPEVVAVADDAAAPPARRQGALRSGCTAPSAPTAASTSAPPAPRAATSWRPRRRPTASPCCPTATEPSPAATFESSVPDL